MKRPRENQMPLPFRSRPKLPNNFIQANRLLQSLEKMFEKYSAFKVKYSEFIGEMIKQDQAELDPDQEPCKREVWYLPHFAVKHPRKDKLRVVFDCNAKFEHRTINEHLLQGPEHINGL